MIACRSGNVASIFFLRNATQRATLALDTPSLSAICVWVIPQAIQRSSWLILNDLTILAMRHVAVCVKVLAASISRLTFAVRAGFLPVPSIPCATYFDWGFSWNFQTRELGKIHLR